VPPCSFEAGDQIDVQLTTTVTDVRCTGGSGECSAAGASYTGKLLGSVSVRMTDRLNGAGPTSPATATDSPLDWGVQCNAGACSSTTTADALIPNLAKEGKRAIWQLGQVEVYDGGPDGDLTAAPPPASGTCPPACQGNGGETVFLRQGLFTP
jgi:hypothetical protein